MGVTISILLSLGGALVGLFCSLLARDIHSCLPHLQRRIISFATQFLPKDQREIRKEEWLANITDLAPSELLRTGIALDCIRAAIVIRTEREAWAYHFTKRALDVFISLVGLIFLAPMLLAAAVFIRIEDGGPVFVRQQRLGKGAVPFGALKFRTYHEINLNCSQHYVVVDNALSFGVQPYAILALTRVGRVLRCSSIDQVPLLVNVLRGEMSLVGPHAALPGTANHMGSTYPGWSKRFECKPGITGYAQVELKEEGMSKDHFRRVADLDVRYAAEQSLRRDLYVLAKTVGVAMTWKEKRGN